VVRGQGVGDVHSRVDADQGEPLVAQHLHQRDQVVGEGAGVVAVLGLVGQPGSALVDRDDLEVPRQFRHQQPPGVPGLGQPCTSSSGRPWPPVTACRRSSPMST
jgi:hypothetical protein